MTCTPPKPMRTGLSQKARPYDPWKYKGYTIEPDNYGYVWSHEDWDLDDPRIGKSLTYKQCISDIDEMVLELEESQ